MQNSLFIGGQHDGDTLKSVIMLELQQFLENPNFEILKNDEFDLRWSKMGPNGLEIYIWAYFEQIVQILMELDSQYN